jgi:hypothetical protein
LKVHGRLIGRNCNSRHWWKIGALAAAGVWTMRRLGPSHRYGNDIAPDTVAA